MKANKIFVILLAAAAISCSTSSHQTTGIVTAVSDNNDITFVTPEGEEMTLSTKQAMVISNPEGILPGMPIAVDFDKKGITKTATKIESPIRSRFCAGTVCNKSAEGFDICTKDGKNVHFTAAENFVLPQCDENTIIVVFYLDEGVAAYAKIRN